MADTLRAAKGAGGLFDEFRHRAKIVTVRFWLIYVQTDWRLRFDFADKPLNLEMRDSFVSA